MRGEKEKQNEQRKRPFKHFVFNKQSLLLFQTITIIKSTPTPYTVKVNKRGKMFRNGEIVRFLRPPWGRNLFILVFAVRYFFDGRRTTIDDDA